jgi:hypothetical protein
MVSQSTIGNQYLICSEHGQHRPATDPRLAGLRREAQATAEENQVAQTEVSSSSQSQLGQVA